LDGANTLLAIDNCLIGVTSVYKLFLTSVIGEFNRFVVLEVNKMTVRQFMKSCKLIQSNSLKAIDIALNQGLSVIEQTMTTSDAKDLSKLIAESAIALKLAYQNQMRSDIEAARADLFRYMLMVVRRVDAGTSQIAAKIAANQSVRFSFVDRAGKKWNSERYVATVTRSEIIKAIYFSFMLAASSKNAEALKLSNDEVVALSVVDKYNHPNTKLIPIQLVI
jgi:hypothetical protein